MTLNFAVLGAGRIGQVHGQAIATVPGARLAAVADAVPAAAESLAGRWDAEVRTIEAIEAAADIDAVVICTPTDTHADLIERFARAGKAIFCEKPVDLDVARVQAALKVVAETKAVLMVGFNRRFDPDFLAVRAAIDAGAVGEVEMITIVSRDPGAPPVDYIARSGGIFRDMTIHDFDMARWMLGEEPVEVFAHGANLVDPAIGEAGDIDSAMVLLKTASGRMAHINNSRRASYGYDQRVEVFGSAGRLIAGNRTPTTVELADGNAVSADKPLHFFLERYAEAYRIELQAFLDALTMGAPMPVGAEDGRQALVLADAAFESLRTGRPVRVA